ncbi:MAG: CDP-archaeol synthase [Chloroflexota bacterium]|nr:CDP-archaeol synthase [Chloroflexota bacterium]
MLATRVATAFIGLPLLFGAVYLGAPWMGALASIAGALAVFEYNRLSRSFDTPPRLLFGWVLTVGMIQAAVWGPLPFLMAFAAAALAMVMFHFTAKGPGLGWQLRFMGAMGPFHVGMPLAVAVIMRDLEHGLEWTVTALVCTMAVDTGAYAVGKLIGRTQMTSISPNKTWEGTLGGVAAGVLAAIGLTLVLELPIGAPLAVAFGLTLAFGAVLGDLMVSAMKRAARVKDTGVFLPGHGGFLDRMDSMLLTLPITFMWQVWTL